MLTFAPVSYTHLDVYKRQSMSLAKNEQETAIWQAYMDGSTYPHYNRLTQGEVSEKNKRIDGGFYFDASEK